MFGGLIDGAEEVGENIDLPDSPGDALFYSPIRDVLDGDGSDGSGGSGDDLPDSPTDWLFYSPATDALTDYVDDTESEMSDGEGGTYFDWSEVGDADNSDNANGSEGFTQTDLIVGLVLLAVLAYLAGNLFDIQLGGSVPS